MKSSAQVGCASQTTSVPSTIREPFLEDFIVGFFLEDSDFLLATRYSS